MRRPVCVLLCSIVATSAAAAPVPQQSWGKAGISFDQYRQDAIECGREGYYLDISQTADAKELVRASRRLDSLNGTFSVSTSDVGANGPPSTNSVDQMARFAANQQHIVESVRPEERFRSIKQKLQVKTDTCLINRGYSRFSLNDDQRHHLRKLKVGSDERHAYLFRLASDPAVLATQAVPPSTAE